MRQYVVVLVKIERSPLRLAYPVHQQLPRLDLVEDLEEQRPKEDLLEIGFARIDHGSDQVLTHPVCGPVRVREPVSKQDWVLRPRAGSTSDATGIDLCLSAAKRQYVSKTGLDRQCSPGHSDRLW